MMSEWTEVVRLRASNRCEYCHLPQAAYRRPFHMEHIIARQHGGSTELENLALACWNCNLKKGPNISGIDPKSGCVTTLFHPRKDEWSEHFSPLVGALMPMGVALVGLTPVGRATVQVLGLNEEMRQMIRYELWLEGRYWAITA
jgi:hypothetical protein